ILAHFNLISVGHWRHIGAQVIWQWPTLCPIDGRLKREESNPNQVAAAPVPGMSPLAALVNLLCDGPSGRERAIASKRDRVPPVHYTLAFAFFGLLDAAADPRQQRYV